MVGKVCLRLDEELKTFIREYDLIFSFPAKTSREVMKARKTWFLFFSQNGITGIGECAPIGGLSIETLDEVRIALRKIAEGEIPFDPFDIRLQHLSSVRFAMETALLDFQCGGNRRLFDDTEPNRFRNISINGLVWMNDFSSMLTEAQKKIEMGFRCIKLKVGSIDFKEELRLLSTIRKKFSAEYLEIRLDANGAFSADNVLEKLEALSVFHIHSIEQPISKGQTELMSRLCAQSPIPIALDEELIGIYNTKKKEELLDAVHPSYIILKPSLHGGIAGTTEWIQIARQRNINWWATSALESNIGLNAIAQWANGFSLTIPQGLGTGGLFINNIVSPWKVINAELCYTPTIEWDISEIVI
ncbi:MAG: o-succinylbenzoate synthase [Crocinitomicaceae bacterium]|nr:o-succinylbenzoate synthase [Crocinitomicaceae bacterium]